MGILKIWFWCSGLCLQQTHRHRDSTEVDLGPGHIVLDGYSWKGHSSPPLFGPCLLWPNATAEHLSFYVLCLPGDQAVRWHKSGNRKGPKGSIWRSSSCFVARPWYGRERGSGLMLPLLNVQLTGNMNFENLNFSLLTTINRWRHQKFSLLACVYVSG